MKKKLLYIVKYSRLIYLIYFYLGSLAIRFIGLFVKKNEKLILFTSFGGRKYDDSPKELYEEMLKRPEFQNYHLIWGFQNPDLFPLPEFNKVKIDTFQYFVIALKATCWITNSSIERGLSFKPKHTFYMNTWHGVPIKKMGTDIIKSNTSFVTFAKSNEDIMLAQGNFDKKIFSRVFGISPDKFLLTGLPRNDILINHKESMKLYIKKKIHIPYNKKIIVYAPTFREYTKDYEKKCIFLPPVNFSYWKEKLSDKYVVLFRAHYEVSKSLDIHNDDFIIDCSNYENLNDLLIVSDLLISDYSSIFFDYAIMNKPMLAFTYDYDEYAEKRGMYFDIREYLSSVENEEKLIQLLVNINLEKELEKVRNFKSKFVEHYGNATKLSVDYLKKTLICNNDF